MSDAGLAPLRRALISASDKTGIVEFAKHLPQAALKFSPPAGPAAYSGTRESPWLKSPTIPASLK
ncbi:MAG: hypothetical protein CM15mP89_4070 [Gammaproteobacteria bacterium]|nr:MAG: hypothetical protein CM15mP89_4070 [Gammaproteobacteria bacterium]